jgi:hypothetical protein
MGPGCGERASRRRFPGSGSVRTFRRNPPQSSLEAIDITVRRNDYGRQADSSIRQGRLGDSPLERLGGHGTSEFSFVLVDILVRRHRRAP